MSPVVVDELELELTLDKAGCSRGCDRPREVRYDTKGVDREEMMITRQEDW